MTKNDKYAFLDFINLMDGADDNIEVNSNSRNLAGGWTNHKTDINLTNSYKDVVNNDTLFHSTTKYSPPGGFSSAIEAVLNYEKEIYQAHKLTKNNILIGHSGSNLLQNLLTSIISKGETILINRPYYPNFVFQSEIAGASIEFLDTVDNNLHSIITEEIILAKIKDCNCKVYLLCLPDNPLGYIFEESIISKIAAALKEGDGYLIIDFSYKLFTYEDLPNYYFNSFDENIIAINSFSKSFGAMGRRFGYIVASEEVLYKVKSKQIVDILCPDSFHQIVYREYFKSVLKNEELKTYLDRVSQKYKAVFEKCKDVLLQNKMTFADSKNGIYFYLKSDFEFNQVQDKILQKGLKVLSGKIFGSISENHLRISIGPLIEEPDKLYNSLYDLISIIKR